MRDDVLWRKIARVILLIADELHISEEQALDRFYRSKVYKMLIDPRYGLQTMSDVYILDEYLNETNN
ncbi:MAG: DUF3791 domain-containing protein [Paludibacteraceae bacterium]|nr:DUF3791 domain-containing protein [Paludibacteraceae bacterium]